MQRFIYSFLFLCASISLSSQSVGIGHTDESTIHESAILDVHSTSRGMLLPRMTKNQRDNIVDPAEGLTIYQIDEGGGYYVYKKSNWSSLGPVDLESQFSFGSEDGSSSSHNIFDGSIDSDEGVLYDIGGPNGNYPNSTIDELTVSAENWIEAIGGIIYVEYLDLNDNGDSLIIDGRPFVSNSQTDTFYTKGSNFWVKFVSDSNGNAEGFKVSWKFIFDETSDVEPSNDFIRPWTYDINSRSVSGGVNLTNGFVEDSLGLYSVQYGYNNKSIGMYSVALGRVNSSRGQASASLGQFNQTFGNFSFSMGSGNYSYGNYTSVFGGNNTIAGNYNIVGGSSSHSPGDYNLQNGFFNYGIGDYNLINGKNNFVYGSNNLVVGTTNYVNTSNALIGGTYCDSLVSIAEGLGEKAPLLLIGIGDSWETRQNGLWFTKSGKLYLGADENDEIFLHNSNIYERFNTDLNFGSGSDHGYIASQEFSGDGGGIYFDGNSITLWNPGDAQAGTGLSNTYLLIVDEDNLDSSDTNPYNNNAIKAYVNGSGLWQQSDEDRKENVVPTSYGLEEILNLSGYEYSFIKNAEEIEKGDKPVPTIGLLAQEVKEHLPLTVEESEHGDHFVNYSLLVPVLIESIKDLKAEIEELKSIINK